ncbi:GumC family protein [Flocculibacter collagenilyticus]|uniref:GumC family protein n=1 Tax=Flocculibacter collagenilyticus TaxID=2744479 RepID=UPI0018F56577|nr:polysaccharide biosynthesis tyrosine autokinase [Flocculibacter collagenilyticus]
MSYSTLIPNAANQSDEIALDELLVFLWERKFRIILLSLLMTLLGAAVILKMPKVYQASATIMLGSSGDNLSVVENVLSLKSNKSDEMDTTLAFLRSRSFIETLVVGQELHYIDEYKESIKSNNGLKKVVDIQHSIDVFLKNLSVTQVADTNLLKLNFNSHDPQLAQQVVNAITPAFLAHQKQFKQGNVDKTSEWLSNQLNELKTNLEQSEATLESYLKEKKLIDVDSQINLSQREISRLLSEKYKNEKELAEIDAILVQVDRRRDKLDKLLELPWLLKNSLITDIRRQIFLQQKVLDQISQRYLHKHPKFIAEKTRLDSLNSELQQTIHQLIESLKNDQQNIAQRLIAIDNQIDSAKEEHSNLGRNQMDLARYYREIEANQKIYEALLTKVKENEILKNASHIADIALIDAAVLPKQPIKPKVSLSIIVIFIVSLIGSVILQVVLQLLFDKLTKLKNTVRGLDLSILSYIPKLNGEKRKVPVHSPISIHKEKTDVQFVESIRTLRTTLLTQSQFKHKKVVAITSAMPDEGKSSVAVNLSLSFAELENVLLIDADLRLPSIGEVFNLDEEHPGLTNLIAQRAKFSECVHTDQLSDLNVLSAGTPARNPLVFLSKKRFGHVIRNLGKAYDRVFIETPPVNTVSDALVIAKAVDSVIVVVNSEEADHHYFIDAIERLQQTGVEIEGVVLNKVKMKGSPYGYGKRVRRRGMINRMLLRT